MEQTAHLTADQELLTAIDKAHAILNSEYIPVELEFKSLIGTLKGAKEFSLARKVLGAVFFQMVSMR
ncbi:MAG: hypothetical protein HQL90_10510 [Magnetococcales bacterium]|nr:hypothetical protein [Magnetococcales bacterium]